jgi:hypothetical protein
MSSPTSPDGLVAYDPYSSFILRSSSQGSSTALVTEAEVSGFGGLRQLMVTLAVTAITLTGGSNPTVQVKAWLQRSPDGVNWDDFLSFLTAALVHGNAAVYHLGEVNSRSQTGGVPAVLQDAGGSPPFAQRGPGISDKLRLKWQLVLTGSPTVVAVTFGVTARGRP